MRPGRIARYLTVVLMTLLTSGMQAITVDPNPEMPEGGSKAGVTKPARFKLNLVVTESEAELLKWLDMSERDRTRYAKTRRFRAREQGHLALVLTDFDQTDLENFDLAAEIELYGPDGKLMYSNPDLARFAWSSPKKGCIALQPQVNFKFDEKDLFGIYTYRATVTDNQSTEIAQARQKVVFIN